MIASLLGLDSDVVDWSVDTKERVQSFFDLLVSHLGLQRNYLWADVGHE